MTIITKRTVTVLLLILCFLLIVGCGEKLTREEMERIEARINSDYDTAISMTNKDFDEGIEALNNEFDELIDDINKDYDNQIAEVRARANERIEYLENSYIAEEIARLEAKHGQKIDQIDPELRNTIEKERDRLLEQETTSLKKELERLEEQRQKALQNIDAQKEEALQHLEEEREEALRSINEEREQALRDAF